MAWIKFIFLITSVLHLTYGFIAIPLKHLKARHYARSTGNVCEAAAANSGELLDRMEYMIPSNFPYNVSELANFAFGRNMNEQSVREELLCRFEGLTTLTELQRAFQNTSVDFQATRDIYGYVLFTIEVARYYVSEALENPPPSVDMDEIRALNRLLIDMEDFRLTHLDPQVKEFIIPILDAYFQMVVGTSYEPPQLEPPSLLNEERKCTRFTNDLRQVWNNMIRRHEEWNPDASNEYREILKNWTGIDLSLPPREIRSKICRLMSAASALGLRGPFEIMRDDGFFNHLLKQGYPHVVYLAHQAKQHIEWILEPPTNDYVYDYYTYYGNNDGNYVYGKRRRSAGRKAKKTKNAARSSYYYQYYGTLSPSNYGYPGSYNYGGNNNNYNYYDGDDDYIDFLITAKNLLENLYGMGLLQLSDDLELDD